MNVSKLANLFHQNTIFRQSNPLSQKLVQPPVNDTLRRLSENLLTAQKQGQDLKKRFDRLELSAEAASQKEASAFSEMPNELLEIYLNQYKVAATLSQQSEVSLMEYRDQLSAFDQTIQEYQDMLDGKTEPPQMMKTEHISKLLERTQTAREQFLWEGAKELNRIGEKGPALTDKAYQMAANDQNSSQTNLRWSIDASAKDIYAEIDRALTTAHQTTSICRNGASRVVAELKRRGCADQPYHQLRFDEQDNIVERASIFQDIYGKVESILQGASEKAGE